MAQTAPQTPEESEAIEMRDTEHRAFYEERIVLDEKGKQKEVDSVRFKTDKFGNPALDKQNRQIVEKYKRPLLEDLTEEITENILGADGKIERKTVKTKGYKVLLND